MATIGIIQPEISLALTKEEIYEQGKQITILIEGLVKGESKSLGSGVIYKKEQAGDSYTYYVLTTSHIYENSLNVDRNSLRIKTSDEKQYQVKVVREKSNLDLAILKFTTTNDYSYAKSDCEDIKGGADIYVFGYPTNLVHNSDKFQMIPGAISSTDIVVDDNPAFTYAYTTTININIKGMSGGPILNTTGCLVGVHRRSDGEVYSGGIVPEPGSLQPKNTGFKIGIPIQPNLRNIQTIISQANQISPSPTPKQTPITQISPSPKPTPEVKNSEETVSKPDTVTVQSLSFKPEEEAAIDIINSMLKAQRKKLEKDNFKCIEKEYNDCHTKVFLYSGNQMERNGVEIYSENYNFAINTTTRGVFHYAIPKKDINLNLKAFVGAMLLPETATSNNPETISIICFTNNLVETPNQIPRPNYNFQKRPNCRPGTLNIEAPEFSENTPIESPKVEEQAPVKLSSIFISNVCESYNNNPSQNQTEALNFLQKQVSENQRPIWINFAQKWRQDSGIVIREPEDFKLTNTCRYYQPENKPNQKEAFQILQTAINNLSSE